MKPDTPFVDQVGDVIADCLKIPPERFDTSMALSRFGVDSIIVTEIMKRMSDLLGTSIAPTVFFEARDAKGLADLLQERYGGAAKPSGQSGVAKTPEPTRTQDRGPSHRKRSAKAQAMLQATRGVPLPPQRAAKPGKAAPSTSYEPIAILAMDGLFADSPDLDSLLSHLEAGTDCISEVPTDRWNWRDVYGDPKDGEFTKVKFGGFAPDIDKFDPLYFDLSPREAQMMDPQHRLFIQSAYRALAQ
ncbi:MAG: beta-ketoacyl synthase N-terminal-like domain-containing protein, partial [Pseudomonadota bacterium]